MYMATHPPTTTRVTARKGSCQSLLPLPLLGARAAADAAAAWMTSMFALSASSESLICVSNLLVTILVALMIAHHQSPVTSDHPSIPSQSSTAQRQANAKRMAEDTGRGGAVEVSYHMHSQ